MEGNLNGEAYGERLDLWDMLALIEPVRDKADGMLLLLDSELGYTTKAGYNLFFATGTDIEQEEGCLKEINKVWSSEVPFSIRAFSWRCFF